jgi:hypothetical protein
MCVKPALWRCTFDRQYMGHEPEDMAATPPGEPANAKPLTPASTAVVSASSQPKAGATGEGAGSAMAHLISQEHARQVPGAVDESANDPL